MPRGGSVRVNDARNKEKHGKIVRCLFEVARAAVVVATLYSKYKAAFRLLVAGIIYAAYSERRATGWYLSLRCVMSVR